MPAASKTRMSWSACWSSSVGYVKCSPVSWNSSLETLYVYTMFTPRITTGTTELTIILTIVRLNRLLLLWSFQPLLWHDLPPRNRHLGSLHRPYLRRSHPRVQPGSLDLHVGVAHRQRHFHSCRRSIYLDLVHWHVHGWYDLVAFGMWVYGRHAESAYCGILVRLGCYFPNV